MYLIYLGFWTFCFPPVSTEMHRFPVQWLQNGYNILQFFAIMPALKGAQSYPAAQGSLIRSAQSGWCLPDRVRFPDRYETTNLYGRSAELLSST